MSFLSRLSLANRSLAALATIAILLIGALVIPSLKQELYPSLEFPAVTVTAVYPGASPAIVERDVTNPLEQSIQGTQGITTLTSYSNQGAAVIIVEYDFGTDIDQASQKLTQQINRIQSTLPSGVTPQVQTFNLSDQPIMQLSVTSNEDTATLASDLQTKLVPALNGIAGVASVNITGVRNQVVNVTVDLKKMQQDSITLNTLQSIFQADNVTLPAGQLTNNGQTRSITVGNTIGSLSDLQNLVIGEKISTNCPQATGTGTGTTSFLPTNAGSSPAAIPGATTANCKVTSTPVKLSDIATIQQTLAPSTSLTRTNGQDSLGVSVTKTSDGNTVSISDAVHQQISALQNQIGNGTKITVISDQAPSISSAVDGLVREGLLGAVFAILVILLFLFSIRSTLVTAISIPLSIVIALIGLWVGDLTLNLFTLGGLTIAVGRVVDDSIVVLENIHRHLGTGEAKQQAVPNAVREVAGAVTASTLTTVAVFLPIAFTGGLVGEVFGPFAITVTVALLASLVVALTVVPVLGYWFLKPPKTRAGEEAGTRHEKSNFLERVYVPMVRWTTKHRGITLTIAIVLFLVTLGLAPALGTNFFSSSQQNVYSVTQTLPVGTSLDTTNAAAQKVEAVLHDTPHIQTYQAVIGASGGLASFSGAAGGSNSVNFSITTDPNADQVAFQQDLQNRLNTLTDAGTVKLAASGGGGFNSSGIAVNVEAPDENTLTQATQQVMGAFSKVANITNISSNLANAAPLVNVSVDPGKALAHGLTPAQVGQLLRQVYTGSTVLTVTFDGQQENVNLQLGTPPESVTDLQNLLLPTPSGTTVKLSDVATVLETEGPTQITHIGGQRTATVSATATTQNVGGVNLSIQRQLKALSLPAGVTVTTGGVAQSQSDAFNSLGIALLIAILLVYLIMVGTFRSLVQPLILLISIPFAGSGSVILMLITHTQLGVPSLIGLLMLIGIVVTNAIVLLDLIHQYRAQGMDVMTAVLEGGRRRLRPILMTAVATILALLPMALGLSKDSGFIAAPLAITVIGGLTTSTLLTLLLVPTLYVLIEGRKDRKRGPDAPVETHREAVAVEDQDTSVQEAVQGA